MQISELLSDDSILAELGQRISRCRIDQALTQAELAHQAGVSKRTVERLEAGASTQVSSMIRILRVLKLLGNLDHAIPGSSPRPMQLLKGNGKLRQRASGAGQAREPDQPWSWNDQDRKGDQ
ncbi:MAG: helix-turn-helix domain-containing protein [Gammaproteobacteria bacterium]|nr:helix-turn-helix domain-containing protein [Gammaproteobacteria bacterium]